MAHSLAQSHCCHNLLGRYVAVCGEGAAKSMRSSLLVPDAVLAHDTCAQFLNGFEMPAGVVSNLIAAKKHLQPGVAHARAAVMLLTAVESCLIVSIIRPTWCIALAKRPGNIIQLDEDYPIQ